MDPSQALIETQRIATIGTLTAALIGGLVGFLGTWIATTVNAKAERRRLLLQLGFDMGMSQYNKSFELAKITSDRGKTGYIIPPYIYVNHNVRILELLAEGKLTPKALELIDIESKEITDKLNQK